MSPFFPSVWWSCQTMRDLLYFQRLIAFRRKKSKLSLLTRRPCFLLLLPVSFSQDAICTCCFLYSKHPYLLHFWNMAFLLVFFNCHHLRDYPLRSQGQDRNRHSKELIEENHLSGNKRKGNWEVGRSTRLRCRLTCYWGAEEGWWQDTTAVDTHYLPEPHFLTCMSYLAF